MEKEMIEEEECIEMPYEMVVRFHKELEQALKEAHQEGTISQESYETALDLMEEGDYCNDLADTFSTLIDDTVKEIVHGLRD